MVYVFIVLSILGNGFFAWMFLVFSAAGLSNPKGTKFAERVLYAELVLLLCVYVGAIVLGVYERGVWGALLPFASVPLLFGTFELKRREAVGG